MGSASSLSKALRAIEALAVLAAAVAIVGTLARSRSLPPPQVQRTVGGMRFLETFKTGPGDEEAWASWDRGFVWIKYDWVGTISEAAWFKTREYDRSQLHLYFDWVNERHACKTPDGLAGQQWASGEVFEGSVYESDDVAPSRKITLDDWVDECLKRMRDD